MAKPQEKLAKIRAQIEALADKRGDIEDAPLTRAEAEARIAAVVDAPYSDQLLDPAPAGVTDGTFGAVGFNDMLARPALLAAVIPDALKAYLMGIYDVQISGHKPGLPAGERRKRMTELATQIFNLEVEEEREIEALESQGVDVLRRPEADPRHALGIEIPEAA